MTGSEWTADVQWAHRLAESLLAEPLPRRWAHTLGVGRRAVGCRGVVGDDADLLVAAALLHDVGYAPDLATTGLHALDGARHLRALGIDEGVVRLVAHHSCAELEAELRSSSVASQLAEIVERSGEDSVVGRFIAGAEGEIRATAARVEALLGGAGT